MLPGLPVSSPKYRWYMSGASKLTVVLTSRRPSTRGVEVDGALCVGGYRGHVVDPVQAHLVVPLLR